MLVGYLRVSPESDRQNTVLQRDALLETGSDHHHLFEDHPSDIKFRVKRCTLIEILA